MILFFASLVASKKQVNIHFELLFNELLISSVMVLRAKQMKTAVRTQYVKRINVK